MQLPIFGISGLRGVVGEDLFPETATHVAAAFGAYCKSGAIAVGRDSRISGEMLFAATVAGLASVGCEVIDLGICPTPTVLHYTRMHNLAGGIIITASHNPDRWNGMKFCRGDGLFLLPADVAALRALIEKPIHRYAEWTALRPMRQEWGAIMEHVAAVTSSPFFQDVWRNLRIGIDAVNGAASQAAQRLVEAFGATAVCVHCDSSAKAMMAGFPRRPEPMPDHLGALSTLVREQGLDAGFAFDPDGDRFSCMDETGAALGEEATICLACRYVLARKPGTVVVNLSTTRAVEDVCAPFGARVIRTAVGEIQVVERVRAEKAVLGGEGNGGVILPDVNPTRDGLVAAAVVLGLMEPGVKLSAIARSLPHYEMVKTTVPVSREEFAARQAAVVAGFPGARVDTQDGLRIDGKDWWLHVRPSNTEPVVRIITEAPTRQRAEEVAQQAGTLLAGNKE